MVSGRTPHEAQLTMRTFSESFLDDYLDAIGDDCTTSVGGYKIEGRGVQLFETRDGRSLHHSRPAAASAA